MFLTVMLVLEGAYPMSKNNDAGFFYYCLAGALLITFFSVVFCLWRDAQKDKKGETKNARELQQTKVLDKLDERKLKLPKWGMVGWIQFILNAILIGLGAIIAYHAPVLDYSQLGLGLAVMALGASLIFNQFNNEDTAEIKTRLKDIKKDLKEIKESLRPISGSDEIPPK